MKSVHMGIFIALSLCAGMVVQGQDIRLPGGEVYLFRSGSSYLGVEIRELEQEEADSLESRTGVYIEEVQPESPAAHAGLQAGDIIVEYAGIPVLGVRHLQGLVRDTPAERTVELAISRNGQIVRAAATLAHRPKTRSLRSDAGPMPGHALPEFHFEGPGGEGGGDFFFFSRRARLGIGAGKLTSQMADFLGVPETTGVLVMEVFEDTPASRAGLQAGDIITAVDGEPVESPAQLSRSLGADAHELEIVRNQQVQVIRVEMNRNPDGREASDAERL